LSWFRPVVRLPTVIGKLIAIPIHFLVVSGFPSARTYTAVHRNFIRQHWNITFAHQPRTGVVAKRILARVLDQINHDGTELRPFFQLSLESIISPGQLTRENAYVEVKAAVRQLAQVVWKLECPPGGQRQPRHLLDTTKKEAVGYHNGVITVMLNPQLTTYLVNPAHYSTFRLEEYLRLSNWYSMRLYELLAAFRDTGVWEVSVEEYRKLMDCHHQTDKRDRVVKDKGGQPKMKYANVADLIKRTTEVPLLDLATTELAFRVTGLKADSGALGRRRIVSLRFELLQPQPAKCIPEAWLAHPVTKDLVEKLRGKWKIKEVSIARYAPVLGRENIAKLIAEWERKENSMLPITDREKYCNAAFVRAAKALKEA